MTRIRRFAGLLGIFSGIVLSASSCRDTEPPPAHARDLGTGGHTLLPTDSSWRNPAVATGQADWHPFRDPTLGEGEEPGSTPRPGAEAVAGTEDFDAEEVEVEIRELIDGYNLDVADATTDVLLDYYVEGQRETLRPWLEAGTSLEEKLAGLRAGLDEKLPDAKQRIESAFATLGGSSGRALIVDAVNVVSDTEAMVTVGGGGMTYRFVVDEDEWFIEIQQIEMLAALSPAIDASLAIFDQWLQGLQSGQIPSETVLAQIEAAAEAAKAVSADPGANPDAERTAEETEEAEAEPAPTQPAENGEGEGGG